MPKLHKDLVTLGPINLLLRQRKFLEWLRQVKSVLKPSGPSSRSLYYSPLDGMPSITRLPPPKISLGFPENLPVLIYTPGWREYSVLPRNTTL